ncbi:MAG TPA: hypothetical protein VGK21_00805 [Candidatus Angelobacter sp.]|jgi:hypothetical protein
MPETSNAILAARRRARDYWDIDGLPALVAGTTTVSVGVICSPLKIHGLGGALVLVLCAWFFLTEGKGTLKWLKSRITYPRTGYVAPPQAYRDSEREPYTIISITKEPEAEEQLAPAEGRASRKALEFSDPPFFLLFILWWFFSFSGWLASLTCLAIALRFWWKNMKDPPWFEIAGAAIAALLSAILTVSDRLRFSIVLVVFGISGMVKGTTLLIHYLRQHPAPQA